MSSFDPPTENPFASPVPEVMTDEVRRVFAALLTHRFLTRRQYRALWETVLAHEDLLRARLEEMFLELVVDRDYEVAFKRQTDDPSAPVMLRRDAALSREATLLLLHMRELHLYADSHDEPVPLSLEGIELFLARYRDPHSTNTAGFDTTVRSAIRALIRLGLLMADPDDEESYTIAPVIVPILPLEAITALQAVYQQDTGPEFPDEDPGEEEDPVTDGQAEDPTEAVRWGGRPDPVATFAQPGHQEPRR